MARVNERFQYGGYEIYYHFEKECFSTAPLVDLFLTQLFISGKWNLNLLEKAISYKEKIEERITNGVVCAVEFCPTENNSILILEEERCGEGVQDFYTDRWIRIFVFDNSFSSLPNIDNFEEFQDLIEESLSRAQNILQKDDARYHRMEPFHGVRFSLINI